MLEKLGIKKRKPHLENWKKILEKMKNAKKKVKIGIVGKYFDIGKYKLPDAYISVIEAIRHASAKVNVKPEIECIDSKIFEKYPQKIKMLKKFDGIIIPGGFGKVGMEGKIKAIEFARKENIPFLGLCLGFQLAVVEFARNVCGLKGANSTEINPNTKYPVIDILPEQVEILEKSKYGAACV
jgi:CTP synthase